MTHRMTGGRFGPPGRISGARGRGMAVLAGALSLTLTAQGAALAATPSPSPAAVSSLGPATAEDEASALLKARLQNRTIEVLSARAADSTTYALPNGSFQSSVYAAPIRVKEGDVWKDINTSLADTGPSLQPRKASAAIALSDGGDRQLASVKRGKHAFGMGWQKDLPAPTVKGDTASYQLGAGERLEVTALADGFSQNVILDRAPTAPVSYRIPLHLEGLTVTQADSGHLLLKGTDGALVAEAPAPMMWDSSKDKASGEAKHRARVNTRIESAADGSQTIVLTPDASFFQKKGLVYPVTVDPTSTLAATTDTWVQTPDYPDSQVSSPELKTGTYNGGADKARSYLKFDVAKFKGKHITDTNLALYSYYSSTCATTGAGTQVRRITSDWSSSAITWGAQPSTTTTGAVTNKAALGYDSSCPAGTVNFDIDAIVQAWADGSPNYGLQLLGASETDSTTWRRFRSANYVSGDNSAEPHLTVTYNSYATTSGAAIAPMTVNAYNGGRYVTSLTPSLSAKVTDADGSNVKAQFEITADPGHTGTAYTYTGTTGSVASGSIATLTVPLANAFPVGSYLRYRVRGYDGTEYGAWSGYTAFAVNTGLPAAPSVSCPAYPAGAWTAKVSGSATCTLDTTSTDGAGYQWSLDSPTLSQRALDTTDGTGGDPQTISIAPGNGSHTLRVRAVDSAGNLSAEKTYSFGVGDSGLGVLAPRDGSWTLADVPLSASGAASFTGARWQYRRGSADAWHDVPVSDVVAAGSGAAVASWPVPVTGGTSAKLVWHMADTLDEDGAVELRTSFTDGGGATAASSAVSVTLDRAGAAAAQENVGPGSVNLLTGDFSMSEDDASVFEASVSRTYSSRAVDADSEGQAPIFGPDWVSSVTATTGVEYTKVRRTSATSVSLMNADGSSVAFTLGSDRKWEAASGDTQLTLTGALADTTLSLTHTGSGTVSAFTRVAGADTWTLSTSRELTEDSTTTLVSEPVMVGTRTVARPKYLISPNKAVDQDNSTCAARPSTAGCRVLEFEYATATTAAGTTLGDVKDQVRQLKVWATDPGAGAATATVVGQYAYDAQGLLREAWDPRVSPAQKTAYTYDAAKRVATYTPAGQLPWTFGYSTATGNTPAGKLLKVSRPTLVPGSATETNGTATTSLVYDVPVSGAAAPYQLDAATAATWGQTDLPVTATAVFPADQVPASGKGSDLSATDYRRATVTYLDADFNTVNTAAPGGRISVSEFDEEGNQVRALTAANRDVALGRAATSDPLLAAELAKVRATAATPAEGTAQAALLLSETTVYANAASGSSLERESTGPLQTVTLRSATAGAGTALAAGTAVLAQLHSVSSYDEGRPAGSPVSDLQTGETTGARIPGFPADADAETVATVYDWNTGLVLKEIRDPQGKALTTTVGYDAAGRQIKATAPESDAAGPGTTITTYWGTTGACAGHPEWAGLVCTSAPGGTVTGGDAQTAELVTKSFTYGRWGQAAVVKETANGVTRTTTTSYDTVGRPTGSSVTGGLGNAVPDTVIAYAADGLSTSVTSGGATIRSSIDRLGREISYEDGAGNTTATQYDALGRPVKVSNSAPSSASYAYDTSVDPRGVLTSITDSVAGSFTGQYDADGRLVSESLPGGYKLALGYDSTGAETSRLYTNAQGTTVLADTADRTVFGQIAAHAQTDGSTVTSQYGYDAQGRLTRAQDDTGSACTVRVYAFDGSRANRTNREESLTDAACGTTGTTTTAATGYAYDNAGRLLSSTTGTTTQKTVHDAFGRRTTAADGSTVGYFASDAVRETATASARQSYALDAAGRQATTTTESKGADGAWTTESVIVSHYGGDGDSPSWSTRTAGGTSTVTRMVADLASGMSAVTGAAGDTVLQLSNVHGDIGVQLPLDTTKDPVVQRFDEYGQRLGTPAARYGWLGTAARQSDTPNGHVLMGARLYDPATGTFLQDDPVQGGGASAYGYCSADPVNCTDTAGTWDYWLKYTVGNPHMSAKRYFKKFRDNFNWVFPIGGHASKLKKPGQKMDLWVKILGVKIAFPVVVKSISSNGFRFNTRWGHPDYPGFISFYFTRKRSGKMEITIHGNVPPFADAWFMGKSNYVKRAKKTWKPLIDNLKDLTHYINTMGDN
ncbi:DNRLRE domain-containing protein [Streptomyces sp. NPDC091268]|uniref:DNRLRE domain-containing protein n=1 Tax=Streptomyces sp. NPDC091268 TaxID=3365979 RepID=UPI0038076E53